VTHRNPLQIAIDGDTLGRRRTGDESYLASLMRGLGRIDPDNHYSIFVRDPQRVSQMFENHANWQFHQVKPASIWIRHPITFPLALRRHKPHVLHSQYFIPPLCPCPVVLTVHDISYAVRPELFTLRDRVLLSSLVPPAMRQAKIVITDTEYTKRDMVDHYQLPPEKIAVIPLAADPRYHERDREACRAELAQRHGTGSGFILYVGTFQPRKNLATLVKAYAQFRKRTGLAQKLLVVGRPKYRYASDFDVIAQSGYADDVILAGFQPDDQLPLYYNAADVFVFPTRYEGFGLPLVEAMSCGTPVISSNASCLPEVAGDGALLVDPEDVEGFAAQLEVVLGNPQTAAQLRERGLRRAKDFSWDQTAKATLRFYQQVVSENE
jgi:glycosyltransferase involved in cell wall biosynthesis